MKRLLVPVTAILMLGCSTSTEEPTFTNPFDPILGAGIPVPDSVRVQVGNNIARIAWSIPEGDAVDEYAIFRKRLDSDGIELEQVIARIDTTVYHDSRVRNDRIYAYRIAAGVGGQFGRRTEEIEARPGLYNVVLNNDQIVTNNRSVTVTFTAPAAEVTQLSEDPDQFDSPWRDISQPLSWTLSTGDEPKTVYARFRLFDGSESIPAFDSITLDTKAVITSLDFDGSDMRAPGDLVHFRMDAGETDGNAQVVVNGILDPFKLFDDGSSGDTVAGDGVYERDIAIPVNAAGVDAVIQGSFTDVAGNSAEVTTASRTLSVREGPDPVALIEGALSEPPAAPAVTLRWSQSTEGEFASYRIYRSPDAGVDSTDRLLTTISNKNTIEFTDSDVIESRTYNYRVYVLATFGLQTGSNELSIPITNLRPPTAVTIKEPDAVSASRVALEWGRSSDLDFKLYLVRRNETGAVTETDPVVAEISDQSQTFFDDLGLVENTSYFYRVYTVDQGDLFARSNEVEGITTNEAPPAVTLSGSVVDTSSIMLTWTESTAHDFDAYEIYRDLTPTVTTSSTLVVEIDESTVVAFTDTELDSGTTYYYRIFVLDDGGLDSKSTGSNTVSLTTD